MNKKKTTIKKTDSVQEQPVQAVSSPAISTPTPAPSSSVPAKASESKPKYLYGIKEYDMNNLKPAQVARLKKLASKIDVKDPNTITNFGSDLTQVMSQNADGLIENVRANKVDELGNIINDVFSELNMIDVDDITKNHPFRDFLMKIPGVRSLIKSSRNYMSKYDTIKNNLDSISKKISMSSLIAERDNNHLQITFDNNISYIKQIGELLVAGELKKRELSDKLKEIMSHPEEHLMFEQSNYNRFIDHLDKKLDDLYRIRKVLEQNENQIQIVQYNNNTLVDKSNDIKTIMIPLWKSQISLAIALSDQKNTVDIQKKMSDATDEMFVKESKMLKDNSIKIAKENERPILSTETIQETQRNLIETVNEIKRIHEEGRVKRMEAQKQLAQLDTDFHKQIDSISSDHIVDNEKERQPVKVLKEVADADIAEAEAEEIKK